MKVRVARRSDKEDIIRFCTSTFSWGDYIDRVWDIWQTDPDGRLFVTDSKVREKNKDKSESNAAIAVSHVSICPCKKSIWIEGIRVHPSYRRSKVATFLIRKMLQYGKQQGAKEASAIVAIDNIASQLMFNKNGFDAISKWGYYSSNYKLKHLRSNAYTRVAGSTDVDDIWNYLRNSEIYKLSGKRYVNGWRWYSFDYKALVDFVKDQRLIITGNPFIDGVAVINKNGYWDKGSILQIVYLDSSSKSSLISLVSFATNLYLTSLNSKYPYLSNHFSQLQIVAYQNEQMSSVMKNFNIEESDQFILYVRKI